MLIGISVESMECLNEDTLKKKVEKYDAFCTSGRDNQIATHATLLNIKYEFYGFGGDLIKTIT